MDMRTHLTSYLNELEEDLENAKKICNNCIVANDLTMRAFWEGRSVTLETTINRIKVYLGFMEDYEVVEAIGRTE